MKRVAIFASYSKENIIPEYVVYYLRGLKKVVNDIIFIADNEVQSGEEEKLKDLVIYSKCERHGCYDFGSYRRGFEWAEQNGILDNADELIFCNDSCYGPVYPFENVFTEMDKMECDFWGMVESRETKCHLQSYFLVFKKNVFESNEFREFVGNFVEQGTPDDYIRNYELQWTSILVDAGFSYAACIDFSQYLSLNEGKPCNLTKYPVTALKLGMPLIKCRVFIYGFETRLAESLDNLLKFLEEINLEVYGIILRDIPRIYSEVRETPTDICFEMSSLVGEITGRAKALQVFNAMYTRLKDDAMDAMAQLQQQIHQNNLQIETLKKNTVEQQTSIADLSAEVKNKQIEIEKLQKKIVSQQDCINQQQTQLRHRSVRIALGLEKKIDRINHTFGWGKYKKKNVNYSTEISQDAMPLISYDAWYEDNIDYSDCKTDVKPIVFYLPQFHAFKENDEWWGKGFTEWTNTKKSKPRFLSHYQPREPHDDFGYYNLTDWKVIEKQARLAKQHGIYGFCFYRYWFAGKTLMETPLKLILEHPEIDINYCLCWANENWTRKWDGNNSDILIGQTYANDSIEYIADIKQYLEDPRYIRVEGKPVIIIYRPNLLPDAPQTFRRWREWARDNGIGEILIWIQRGVATFGKSEMFEGADAEIEFPPSGTAEFDQYDITRLGAAKEDGNLIGYRNLVNNILRGKSCVEEFKHKVYRGVTLGWDNSPRREQGFWATWGFSLVDYYRWLNYVVHYTRTHNSTNERFFFINAWNEWAEGTYLEPDKRFGYSSINVTSRAIFDLPLNAHIDGYPKNVYDINEKKKVENLISRNLPLFPYSLYSMYHNECEPSPSKAWEECNKLEDPVNELERLHERFVHDNTNVLKRLSLKRVMLSDVVVHTKSSSPKKIGVQLHLFYQDMIPFFKKYLTNIPAPFDLLVSVPQATNEDLENIKTQFEELANVENVIVKSCINKGRDIAPLICTFKEEILSYDYIAHIHSKKSLHTATHNIWAEFILNHLMGTTENISRIFHMLDEGVGVISPPDFLMMPEQPSGWGSNIKYAQKLLDLGHVDIDLKREFPIIEFPQGSMFWARTDYLRKLFELPITYDDFPAEPIGVDGTIAHAFERLFYIWGIDTGMQICQVFLEGEESLMFMQR